RGGGGPEAVGRAASYDALRGLRQVLAAGHPPDRRLVRPAPAGGCRADPEQHGRARADRVPGGSVSKSLRIAGGTVYTPAGRHEADVLVDDGRITGVVSRDTPGRPGEDVVDATGKVVLPGMVDVHVHTREPGFTHKEDIVTTTEQAAL